MKGQAGGVKEQTWAKGETHPNSSRFFSNSIWQCNIIAVISAKSVNLYFYPQDQCSPYQVVTGKIYRLKQHFLPPAAAKKYASCDPIRSPRENE